MSAIGSEPGPGRRELLRGIALLLAAVTIVPIMDGIAKELSQTFPVLQVTWARYVFNLAFILPIVLWRHGLTALRVNNMPLQLLRGTCLLLATFSFFYVLKFLPLAETLALAFTYPLIVTAFSPLFLDEQVGWRRYAAVGVGFLGALIIVQPGTALFQPIAALGLLPGWFFAGYIILTRKLAGTAPHAVTLAYGAVIGAVILSLSTPFIWVPPGPSDWMLFASLGLLAAIAHLMMIKAYEAAPASVLAPLGYAEMPMAVLIGWIWFNEWPSLVVWLGIAIIISSGVFISWRETRRA